MVVEVDMKLGVMNRHGWILLLSNYEKWTTISLTTKDEDKGANANWGYPGDDEPQGGRMYGSRTTKIFNDIKSIVLDN